MNTKTLQTKPKYLKIKEKLKEEIDYKRLNMLSEREVIHRFNVSSITARRVLNELEDEGYIERQVGKGSIVIEKKTKEIGIIFYSFREPSYFFIPQVMEGIEEAADKSEYQLHLYPARTKSIKETKNIFYHLIHKNKLNGILILSPLPENDVKFLQERKIPFVVVANYYPGIDCSYVIYDYKGVTRKICERLYKDGVRKIGLVIGERGKYGVKRTGDMIYDGYKEFLESRNIKEEIVIETKYEGELKEMMKDITRVDFMIIGNVKVSDEIINKRIEGNFVLYTYKKIEYPRNVFFSYKEYGRVAIKILNMLLRGERKRIKIKLNPVR